MTNLYFNNTTPVVRHTRGRAPNVNDIFGAVAAGFDLLPAPAVLREGRFDYLLDTGAANAYVVTFGTAPLSYSAGMSIKMRAINACTGASTINVNSLGVKSIKTFEGATLATGDIVVGIVHLVYDSISGFFRIVGSSGASAAAAAVSAAAAAVSASSASTSASSASTSATSAQTAKTNAETAETNAETAQAAAENAADDAISAASDAQAAADNLSGTSASSVAIGTGSKSFTTQAGKSFDPGTFLVLVSDADSGDYMTGQVTAYSGTSLTVDVSHTGGSGTNADWNIFVAGRPANDGDDGAPGAGSLQPFTGCIISTASAIVTDAEFVEFIAFDSADTVDTNSFHNPAVNNTRITIPAAFNGYYADFDLGFIINSVVAENAAVLQLYKNGALVTGQQTYVDSRNGGAGRRVSFSSVLLATSDYFEIRALNNAGDDVSFSTMILTMRVVSSPVGAQSTIFPSYTDSSRPSAGAVTAGTAIWNTDDGYPNWSDGANWVEADGTST